MPNLTLGIIGGGQLGSLLAVAAKKLEIKTVVFCDDADAPAQKFSNDFVIARYSGSFPHALLNGIGWYSARNCKKIE